MGINWNNINKVKCPNCNRKLYPNQFGNYLCENCGWDPDDN